MTSVVCSSTMSTSHPFGGLYELSPFICDENSRYESPVPDVWEILAPQRAAMRPLLGRKEVVPSSDFEPPSLSCADDGDYDPWATSGKRRGFSEDAASSSASSLSENASEPSELASKDILACVPLTWDPVLCHSDLMATAVPDTRCSMTPDQLHEARLGRDDFDTNGTTRELDDWDRWVVTERRAAHMKLLSLELQLEYSHKMREAHFLLDRERQRVRADVAIACSSSSSGSWTSRAKSVRSEIKNHCVFCKKNNEMPCLYNSHVLKNDKGDIVCPILCKYVCPICSATGKRAHTVKYCPLNNGSYETTADLLLTARLSTGKKRRRTISVSGSPPS